MSIISENTLGDGVDILVIDHSPTEENTDCGAGSLIVYVKDEYVIGDMPQWFIKSKDGDNSNVVRLITRHKMDATAAPTVSDSNLKGFNVGSKWFDKTSNSLYFLVDEDAGEWIKVN